MRSKLLAVCLLLACLVGALTACGSASDSHGRPTASGSLVASESDAAQTSSTSGASSTPASPTPTKRTPPPPVRLAGAKSQRTPGGQWWGVDSTAPIGDATLANVRGYYAGNPTPLVWGRYVSGSYALEASELAYARQHGIYLYLLIPDADCSVCSGGGDVCGNDHTAAQATADARDAIAAARRLKIPRGAVLYKDIEQIGSCTGELTATYLDTWRRTLRGTPYRPGFYGNATAQSFDFPRAYCQMLRSDPSAATVPLADDEPEPAISAPPGTIGPANAPRFGPDAPSCAPRKATKIWQYGESTSNDNSTDVDEIQPDTPGLLTPTGTTTT